MNRTQSPQEAYRRIDLDARVSGARISDLVDICYEQLIASLGTAIYAAEQSNNSLKSQSLTRALSAITALQMGIDLTAPIAKSLAQFYGSVRKTILDSAITFDSITIGSIREDFLAIQSKNRVA